MVDHAEKLKRRRLLGGVGTVALAGVGGCASFSGPHTATGHSARITVLLSNADQTERAYEVEVDWGENNKSLFTGTLQPDATDSEMIATTGTAPESAQFRIVVANTTETGTWTPTECPDYRVDAVIENGTPSFDATCQR